MKYTNRMFTRADIEEMKALDRPSVRVKYDADLIDEDGRTALSARETTGRIVIDGNNPWVEIWAAGGYAAERFSWGLVLEVLNDRFAAPIYFSQRFEYEVHFLP